MPGKISNRKKQALAMREHIKETAMALFDEHGFENVTMEEIAEAAGCSVGNIYHYFKSKDELSLQVTDHVDTLYAELWEAYEADRSCSAMEKLLDFVERSLEISYQEEVLYRSFAHAVTYPEQRILAYKKDRVWFRVLNAFIEQCKAEGSIPAAYPSEQILNSLVAIHRGMLMQYRIEQEAFPLGEWGKCMARAYLNGLQK